MAFTGTARDALFRTAADPVPIRGSVGTDAGAVAGKRDAVLGDKPVLKGGEEGSRPAGAFPHNGRGIPCGPRHKPPTYP